jgi:hypothetical protein
MSFQRAKLSDILELHVYNISKYPRIQREYSFVVPLQNVVAYNIIGTAPASDEASPRVGQREDWRELL